LVELLPKFATGKTLISPPILPLASWTFQVDTNAPIVTEFGRQVEDYSAHPEKLPFLPELYFDLLTDRVYYWCQTCTSRACR